MSDTFFREREPFSPLRYEYSVEKVLYHRNSEYQEILVFENPFFGRVLVLDGIVQLTERDECIYHEMLVHIGMCAHPAPSKVLIIGGGDGGTLREVTKHRCVKEVWMVELDRAVVEVSKEFFPTLATAFDDPRLKLIVEEGAKFLRNSDETFDIIVVDSTDPIGPARNLIEEAFFRSVFGKLRDSGVFAMQSESLFFHSEHIKLVRERLRKLFPVVELFTAPIATYPGNWWSFSAGSKGLDLREPRRQPDFETKYYTTSIHRLSFPPEDFLDKVMGWV